MTEPRRFPFDLSITAIKEFARSFTGQNPDWDDDQQDAELHLDLVNNQLPPIEPNNPEVKEFTDLMQGVVDSEDYGDDPNPYFDEDMDDGSRIVRDDSVTCEDVLLANPVNYPEIKHAKGELATANMVLEQEAFRIRIVHENLDTLWGVISSAVMNAVGPNRMKVGDPRYGKFNTNQISHDIHEVIESMQDALEEQLQNCIYDYDSAMNDVDIAEWMLSRETNDHSLGQIPDDDIELFDFDEGYNDYRDTDCEGGL